MDKIREYNELEKVRTFEKRNLIFQYTYKGKNYDILITCPVITKKYEKNPLMYGRVLGKIDKYFYKMLICNKNVDYEKHIRIGDLIHWLFLSDYDIKKYNKEFKYCEDDFLTPYTFYLL